MMTSRQRVLNSLAHKTPDRIPFDLGSSGITGLHCSVVKALRNHYGLETRPVKIHEPYQMLGFVDKDLQQVFGVDVEGVPPSQTMFGFPVEGWKPWRTPWGQEVLVPSGFVTNTDDSGNLLIYPCGDITAPASGIMPDQGYFFDTIIRQEPIDEENLDIQNNLEEFGPMTDTALSRFAHGTRSAAETGRAVLAGLPGTTLGGIGQIPAPFLRYPKGIRDITEWYMSIAARPQFVKAIFEKQVEIALNNLKRINDEVGEVIDVVNLCGTDFGTQQSTFCSEATFRDIWLPNYKQMTNWIHENTRWKVFKHCDGAVAGFMEAFIEAGFDIFNPLQCSAAGMDPANLKQRFGSRITFWGGGVDTQNVLPFGTPQDVRAQVLERCEILGQDGGFVFNAVHNIQAKTPTENVVAMIEAFHEFNGSCV